jgi:hypothetical protein
MEGEAEPQDAGKPSRHKVGRSSIRMGNAPISEGPGPFLSSPSFFSGAREGI